jgi:hypothetical protein
MCAEPIPNILRTLTDDELLRSLAVVLVSARRVESELVAHIREVDERRLFAREGSPSMFAYCVEFLNLSEPEAYLRIAVARASGEHPMLLDMLADGRLHLSGIAKLAPLLTLSNRDDVLARAAHKSKRQIEEIAAELAPRPDVPATVRKLPEARSTPVAAVPVSELRPDGVAPAAGAPSPPAVQPLAPGRYKVQFTASATFHDKLQKLKALMRGSVPDGDLATILERAVTESIERLERKRFGRTAKPRKSVAEADVSASSSRYIPAPVRRAVSERDNDRCGFVNAQGRRCSARAVHFDHHQPHARAGDRSPDNMRLMCRTHNLYLAELEFGKEVIGRYRRPRLRGT